MANRSNPPTDARSLAKWFAEGVRPELAALEKEKKGSSQSYELLSGRLVDKRGPNEGIYQFIIADGTRIPEESEGRLITANEEYAVTVIGQLADRIDLSVQAQALPPGIQRAMLIIDDTALLRKLAEALEEISENRELSASLAVAAFHPRMARVGFAKLTATPALVAFDGTLPATSADCPWRHTTWR